MAISADRPLPPRSRGEEFFTPEQHEIRDLVRALARERIAPRAAEIDKSAEFPWDIVQLYRENGLFGLMFDEEHGGVGSSALMTLVAIEEVAKIGRASCRERG